MLTTKETAERLDADPGTVRMWCINGTLPNAIQEETPRGPVWMIPETDLSGFNRRGRGRPPKPVGDDQAATAPTEADATAKPAKKAGKTGSKKGKAK